MELDHALATTRSVRKRLDLGRPVERSVIEECLEVAFQAPNGWNLQLWRWVIVDDPDLRAAMADIYRASAGGYSDRTVTSNSEPATPRSADEIRMTESVLHLFEHLQDVPVLVVPTMAGRMEDATIFHQATRWGSMIPAVWSFMLALRGRGLGSSWTTIHLHREREMAELLGIPYERHTQVGLFPVAYTLGEDFRPAPRRPLTDVAAWNTWPTRTR